MSQSVANSLLNVVRSAMSQLDYAPTMRSTIAGEVALGDQIERCERGAFDGRSLPGPMIPVFTAAEVERRSGGVTQHTGSASVTFADCANYSTSR